MYSKGAGQLMSVYRADTKDIDVTLSIVNKSNSEAYRKIIPQEYFKEPVFTRGRNLGK